MGKGKVAFIFSGINDQIEALQAEKRALLGAANRIDEIDLELGKLRDIKADIRTRFGDAEVDPT